MFETHLTKNTWTAGRNTDLHMANFCDLAELDVC